MKSKHSLILLFSLIAVLFVISCAPQQQKAPETPSAEKELPTEIKQQPSKDDFGCFYSCNYFPEGFPRQMCEDWKAGKQVQWPPDCSMMQYGPCIKLCERKKQETASGEQKQTVSVGEQKQAFNVLPSLVKAEFASDVNEADKGFVITGISAMDSYLQKWFGKSINQLAGLRVDAVESTENRDHVVVEDGKIVILIGTRDVTWKGLIETNKYGGENRDRISVHEYVHVYQAQNGCAPLGGDWNYPKWFLEGEAEWLSYKAMHEAGLLPSFGFPQYSILLLAKQEMGSLKSFEKVEKDVVTPSRYSFYAMAIDYLMKDKPIKALDDFCADLAGGKGMSVPEAFEAAFGIPLEKFYDDFEAYRKTW